MMDKRTLVYIGFAAVLFTAPIYLNRYWVDVLNNVGLYAILALSLNIILGHAGMFHMGHAAFYAIGAYTTAVLNTTYGVPVLWIMPLAGVLAGVFALIVARPIIHLRGDYLLIVTIGMVEIVRIALINDIALQELHITIGKLHIPIGDFFVLIGLEKLTGGANGIFGIDRPNLFGMKIRRPHEFFYLIWLFAAITCYLLYRLENSRFGRALNFLREDEVAAEGSGINTAHYKLAAFVLGAVWAGMLGTIYAAKMTIISPESFSFWESVLMFMIVILGGSGNIAGVILGAFLVIGLPEIFRGFANARMLIFGGAMVAMMVFRPQGILPPRPRSYPVGASTEGLEAPEEKGGAA